MLRSVVKATVCSLGIHDWDEHNRCARCGRVGCSVGRHIWKETNRHIVVSPQPCPDNGLSDDWRIAITVRATTRVFYECPICGKSTQEFHIKEGYAGWM